MTTTTHTTTDIDALVEGYFDRAARLTTVVQAGGDWDGASPCEGWTATDVLDHVIDTQRDFLAQQGVDLGPAPTGEPAERWAAHLNAVRRVLGDRGIAGREYDGYFGRTTIAATMATFYGFDLVAHRWDLARALGHDDRWTEAEMDALDRAVDGFGEHFYAEGISKPALPVPDGADRQTALLARMGRRA
ncbi:maleylpyruvate isomerase family mycothiol-dependent enzyme [Nocardioides ferulae]|uniref:maleylpyruvate isomerase family mycothiol-dependent enzyme n=1 Tax=Nocardioides ferulae TaxID=2340821 RepID=UPI000EAB568D|nr:maleylpyruvate isomerase family mycothiol-dependent enzyme [Nocardioides ferulae]